MPTICLQGVGVHSGLPVQAIVSLCSMNPKNHKSSADSEPLFPCQCGAIVYVPLSSPTTPSSLPSPSPSSLSPSSLSASSQAPTQKYQALCISPSLLAANSNPNPNPNPNPYSNFSLSPNPPFVAQSHEASQGVPCVAHVQLQSNNNTTLQWDGGCLHTPEHFLAACAYFGGGTYSFAVHLSTNEFPILDGSALPWYRAMQQLIAGANIPQPPRNNISNSSASSTSTNSPNSSTSTNSFTTATPASSIIPPSGAFSSSFSPAFSFTNRPFVCSITQGNSHISVAPAPYLQITLKLNQKGIQQEATVHLNKQQHWESLLQARTFIEQNDFEQATKAGLLQGATAGCGILYQACQNQINVVQGAPLRFSNEFALHKILDLVGDLALLGIPLPAWQIEVCNGGHWLNHILIKRFIHEYIGRIR
jgi:UDP-3-O-acyl-N-acetylglucosamine deacetylase